VELRLISVNVSLPRIIGRAADGQEIWSGIAKRPLAQASVFVAATNIAGDGQADLTVHGGVDKAVYAYPSEHWPWWEQEKMLPSRAATFGENLTVEGADESNVAIGDRFRWGDALLEVSQPRAPCFKFAIYTARADAPQLMTLSGRCGWYYRVIEQGNAPVMGATLMRVFASSGPSVRDAFLAVFGRNVGTDSLRRVEAAPGLAESWRNPVLERLARRSESH
jgi:MOSC domain-containing protein YiiM